MFRGSSRHPRPPVTLEAPELASLPDAALAALSSGCSALGSGGVRVLREAGRRAGERLVESLAPLPISASEVSGSSRSPPR